MRGWRQQSTICCDGLVLLLVSSIHTFLWSTKPCVSSVGACHIPFWHSVRFFRICDDKLLLLAHIFTQMEIFSLEQYRYRILAHAATLVFFPMKSDKKQRKAKCDLPCSFVVLFSNKFSLCRASSCFDYGMSGGSIEFHAKSGKFSIILAINHTINVNVSYLLFLSLARTYVRGSTISTMHTPCV